MKTLRLRAPVLAALAASGALAVPAPCAASPVREAVDPVEIQRAAANPQAQALRQRIASARTTGELAALLRELTQDSRLGLVGQQLLVDFALHQLAGFDPTPSARTLVDRIAQQAPAVYAVVDPEQHTSGVPAIDPGATARFVLRSWDRRDARDRALAALRTHADWPLERFSERPAPVDQDTERGGVLDAYKVLSANELRAHRAPVAAALERGARVDEVALVMAMRLQDPVLYQQVLGYASVAVALDAVRQARLLFPQADALEVLASATERHEIASAAILQIGALAAESPPARERLLAALHDPAVASSAAAALASLHSPSIALLIGDQLTSTASERTRRQLVLALKLDGSQVARTQLDRFVRSGKGSAPLRREVSRWLAE